MRLFVTVGTTSFDELIRQVDTQDFLRIVRSMGVTQILAQIGRGSYVPSALGWQETSDWGAPLGYYRFKSSLAADISSTDIVVGHGGSGTILECLRANKTLLVVVNTSLMANHQEELGWALADGGHVIHCTQDEVLSGMNRLATSIKDHGLGPLVPLPPALGRPLFAKMVLDLVKSEP